MRFGEKTRQRIWLPHFHSGIANYGDSAMAAVIFKLKLNALMKFIRSRKVLGEIRGFVWRVECQKRGLPHTHRLCWSDFNTNDIAAVDKVLNVQFPRESPFPEDQETIRDFQVFIRSHQLHTHSRRFLSASGRCKFGYPHIPSEETMIRRHTFILRRNKEEGSVVPHNPTILASFRCHRCLEIIHSEQCIGSEFDHLTSTEYYARYIFEFRRNLVVLRRKPVLAIINSVSI
jgi:hypothetical protein